MKEIDFTCQTAVVTGAASGMGLCASRELVRLGATVVLCDVDAASLGAAAASLDAGGFAGRACPCPCDVRRFADAERAAALALERTGRIDLLAAFAGGYEPRVCGTCGTPFHEQPVEVIDWGLDVNLRGPVYFARACMPAMVRAKRGVICCIGSVTGFEGDGCGAMYGTAKSGLFNFVKGLAQAGAPHGVRAFCVTPGPVMTRPGMANMKTLQGRAYEPSELVDLVLYLASENGASVTGSNHVMDCGRLAMQPQ